MNSKRQEEAAQKECAERDIKLPVWPPYQPVTEGEWQGSKRTHDASEEYRGGRAYRGEE